MYTVTRGHVSTVAYLCAQGAEVDLRSDVSVVDVWFEVWLI